MPWLTDEARSLPPPSIVNKNSVWLGFLGYLAAITNNGIKRLPALRAGKGTITSQRAIPLTPSNGGHTTDTEEWGMLPL
uniref:Uncharacterized protein n=1 Tax=Leptobrachium leishanense TaxID=445787 RepID=A0A8C5M469_9ANUR